MSDLPLFLRACFNQPTERTPMWLMRQAGRYMPEYRAIRKDVDFWTLCKTPDLACEVTLQPIDAFGLDAAIIFSDLLVPLPPMGADVTFEKGMGPVIHQPIESPADVDRLVHPDVADTMGYVGDAVKTTVAALPADVPLIGFAGAPFTLASYLIEGGGSKHFMKTKAFLHQHPAAAEKLFTKLTDVVIDLLNLQIDNGVRAVQVFDSWAGVMDPVDYARWGLPWMKRILDGVRRPGIATIAFAKGTGCYFDVVAQCGADALGVDWTLPLDKARALAGPDIALQGNLDPGRLLGPWEALVPAIDRVLDAAGDGQGHIFNLGHGIDRFTDPAQVARLADYVRVESPKRRG
jgi:uroporphyrinogen decarboxylase